MSKATSGIDPKQQLNMVSTLANSHPQMAADILSEYRATAAHLREMDKRALNAQTISTYLGQVFGLLIGITAILAGSYTAVNQSPLAGGFIGGGGVIGLVSVFVLGRRKSS